jgi:hypothetical protein
MATSINFSDETESAGYNWLNSAYFCWDGGRGMQVLAGSLNSCSKSEGAICKTIRYRKARFIWFACSKIFLCGFGVSVLIQGIFILSNVTQFLNICSPHLHAAKLPHLWKQHLQKWLWFATVCFSNKHTICVTYRSRNINKCSEEFTLL